MSLHNFDVNHSINYSDCTSILLLSHRLKSDLLFEQQDKLQKERARPAREIVRLIQMVVRFDCQSKFIKVHISHVRHFFLAHSALHLNSTACTMVQSHFNIRPQTATDNNGLFVFDGQNFLFTLKDALPKQNLLEAVARATTVPLEGYAYSHEDTSEDRPDGSRLVGYTHTHFAIRLKSRIRLLGARKFDVYMGVDTSGNDVWVHPNVQKLSTLHLEQVMTQYLAGRKYSIETGTVVYKEPLEYECVLPPQFEFTRALIEEVVAAPTLVESCVVAQVRPKHVNDCAKLREAAEQATKKFKHMFEPASFKMLPIPAWHFLHIHGGTGLGKTKWAVAQFKNPCVVKPFNSIGSLEILIRKFDPVMHDGIVLDEADFKFMSVDTLKCFTDTDEDCTLMVRFKAAELPPIPKIAVSNPTPQALYPADPSGAVQRRVTTFHITEITYRPAPPAPLAQPPPLVPPPLPQLRPPLQAIAFARNAAANAAVAAWGTQ